MCGIAGIVNLNGAPVEEAIVASMTATLAHRGPDGDGVLLDGAVGLGHRRLAVLDLSHRADQPMVSADGSHILSYNGEIYNYRELRRELEKVGHVFRSTGDTEVVLNALVEWGEDALLRFNGMFALAFWNKKTRQMLLARDRYGIKPLYYSQGQKTFLFGSEVKALLAHPVFKARMDEKGLLEYFTFQNFFTDRTLFKGITLLPAGSYLRVGASESSSPVVHQYWDFDFREPEHAASEGEYIEELDRLFTQAVKRQLMSDVDVGGYLSSGIDSGAIIALATREVDNFRSFTIGFDLSSASGLELGFDERSKAEEMSYLYKSEHYEMVLKSGDMERSFADLVWHLEEPRVGQSYPNYYAAKLAGKFNKVVLSGTGGDELFGGYPWRYYRAVINEDYEDYIDKYYAYWQRLIPNKQIHNIFRPISAEIEGVWTRDIFKDVFRHHADTLTRPEDYINHSLYFEAKTFLHGLLVVEDKLNMAHGVETRVPFLDNDLVDFAMSMPVGCKLGNLGEVVRLDENEPGNKPQKYYEKTRDGKLLMRKMMKRYVPESVTEGIKQGFSGPDASWFKGESIDFVRRSLLSEDALIYNYLDRGAVHKLINSHLDGSENRRLLIWSLLSVEQWCKTFLE